MFNLFENTLPSLMTKKKIAKMLKVSPQRLAEFEESYQKHAIDYDDGNLFSTSSRKISQEMHAVTDTKPLSEAIINDTKRLTNRIVDELLANTNVFTYDGKTTYYGTFDEPTAEPVTLDEIRSLPEELRPQLSGTLMKKDVPGNASDLFLFFLNKIQKHPESKASKHMYHQFRQGLDIMDLDWLSYKMIDTNPTSIGHWLPALIEANADKSFFKIPATTICKVPITLLQLTRLDYQSLTQTTLDIINKWAVQAFHLDENKQYFIRTGTHSSKFDFRNAYVHDPKEVLEIGEYLTFIHNQGVLMAGYPLNPQANNQPSTYGMSTTVEWAVREFIPDKENNPKIYKGLPLHTEYRVFIDCDTDCVLSITPYWEPETMKKRFGHESDADSPHQIHDYIIYQAHEETLMRRYHENKDRIVAEITKLLPDLNLTGQWSLDIMQNGDDFWLIDMATAQTSAFYNTVPKQLRNPQPENWLPDLS